MNETKKHTPIGITVADIATWMAENPCEFRATVGAAAIANITKAEEVAGLVEAAERAHLAYGHETTPKAREVCRTLDAALYALRGGKDQE